MYEVDPIGVLRGFLSAAERDLVERLMALPGIAADAARDRAAEELRHAGETIAHAADRLRGILSRLPHDLAEVLLGALRIPAASRLLSAGEQAAIAQAHGAAASPLARKTFVSCGPGKNPIAIGAFINGNPAITIGNTIYVKPMRWKPDYAAPQGDLPLFLHEFTHVVQWDRMGYATFLARYRREMKAAGSADALYDYQKRKTDFGHETLEGQAQMVEDYTVLRRRVPPGQEGRVADLRRRLTGSRVYGL